MAKYSEKLRDPRWQRKRLEIMQRDNFACGYCSNGNVTLNVHHRWYVRGADPWDYPGEALVTLCEDCHKFEHDGRHYCEDDIAELLKEKFLAGQLFELVGILGDLKADEVNL